MTASACAWHRKKDCEGIPQARGTQGGKAARTDGRLEPPTSDQGTCVVASEPLQDLDLRGTSLRERPELGPSPLTLVRCDLLGADLRGLDLPGWQFHDCNLDEAKLNGTRLIPHC